MAPPRGILTFLFTDVVGSSELWDQASEAMRGASASHDEIVDKAIRAHDGHVVKKTGDGFMAVFSDPANAISAAVEAQTTLGEVDWGDIPGPISSRMGIHTGPADTAGEDYVGPTVNRAARLQSAGHGGQILASAATEALISEKVPSGVSLRDLGEHHLRGLSRPERVFQVEGPGLSDSFPPLQTESTPSNFPSVVQELIGRREEIEEVVSALSEHRLVTITGPGGAGKTTLAQRAARRRARDFPAGVWLVELAGHSDGRRLATEILGTIRRAAPADRDPLEVLTAALQSQRTLLVIDNCEHLREDVARVVSHILRNSEQVKVLATSREPLGTTGEQVWRIPPMALPQESSSDSVLASDAGELFVTRARAADAGFTVTEENADLVADLCRRLDGLPLAIELACVRLRSMGIEDLSQRLDDRFRILKRETSGQPDRHDALRDTVMWSYELLGEEEQRLFRRLSVFAGGFDLEAAEAVGSEIAEDTEVIDLVDHLVAQSLIQHVNGRYSMLETIRQLGAELLEQHDEADEAGRAQLRWLAELARRGGRQLEGKDQVEWLRRFQGEIDNMRTSFAWALENDPVTGAAAAGALTRFFWMNAMEADTHRMTDSRSFLTEGYDWAVALLEAAGEELPTKTRARLQSGIGGMLCVRSGRYTEGVERLKEAQRLFRDLDDDRGLGWSLFYDGVAGWGLRPIEETADIFRRSQEIHARSEDKAGRLFSGLLLGWALGVAGDHEEGREHIERFAESARALQIPNVVAHADEGVATFDAWQDRIGDDTRRLLVESLEAFRSIHNYACVTHVLGSAAIVLTKLGDLESPGVVVGISQAIRERLNMVLAPYEDRIDIAANTHSTAAAIHEAKWQSSTRSWEAAIAEGQTMEPDEGIDWTIRRLGHEPASQEIVKL